MTLGVSSLVGSSWWFGVEILLRLIVSRCRWWSYFTSDNRPAHVQRFKSSL
jgi:hypothetical protein